MPDNEQLHYFAYGSNLLPARLLARTPSARFASRAWLADHRLSFDKRGRDGSGKATIVAAAGCTVPGVVYRLDVADLPHLDAAEGCGFGYDRVMLDSNLGPVMTYRAPSMYRSAHPWPYDWYRALVLAGARWHGLPTNHRQLLAAQPAWEDPQQERANAAWAIIAISAGAEPAAVDETQWIHLALTGAS